MKIRNTFIIFTVSGFWHGANWTFIIWGLINALYFIPLLLTNRNRSNLGVIADGRIFPSFNEFINISLIFMTLMNPNTKKLEKIFMLKVVLSKKILPITKTKIT